MCVLLAQEIYSGLHSKTDFKAIVIKTVWCGAGQTNRTEYKASNRSTHIYGKLIRNICGISNKWKKNGLFTNWFRDS